MKRIAALFLVACGSSAPSPEPAIGDKPVTPTPAAPGSAAPERRCLPVVAKDCRCVYSCGTGERHGDRRAVHHSFWKDTELQAVVEPWCVEGKCTDVFAATIVCDAICAPKPADPTCRFDAAGACAGAGG